MTEDKLIEGLKLKDRAAFEYAYFTYKDLIFRAICKYVSVIEDAEELVQDVFVKTFVKIEQFNGTSRLSTWLVKIAINTSLNFLKNIKKQKEVIDMSADVFDLYNEDGDDNKMDGPTPEELMIQKDGRKILLNAFTKLTSDQHTACNLFYLEGMQQLEIAETMDTSLDAVESLIQRGKIKLRSILKNEQLNISI